LSTESKIVGLSAAQIKSLGAVLARAFHDDPLPVFVAPSERRRPAILRAYLSPVAPDAIPFGHAYAAVDVAGASTGVHGVAAWLPPGAYPPSVRRQLRQLPGLVRIVALAPRRMPFVLALLTEIERMHPKDDHWYLALLAVDPSRQGQGIGRRLLAPALARADADGLPCYLETTKAANIAWYRVAGFDVVDELRVRDGPPTWIMRREAR
jgi:ribosomal protein S18 acetylase RimI-like enzyme